MESWTYKCSISWITQLVNHCRIPVLSWLLVFKSSRRKHLTVWRWCIITGCGWCSSCVAKVNWLCLLQVRPRRRSSCFVEPLSSLFRHNLPLTWETVIVPLLTDSRKALGYLFDEMGNRTISWFIFWKLWTKCGFDVIFQLLSPSPQKRKKKKMVNFFRHIL